MVLLLSTIIVVLLLIIGVQFYFRRNMKRDLNEIQKKLFDIIEQKTTEKVLIQTDQKVTKQFLIQINRLLEYNQQVIADYVKTKESLRKLLSNMSHDLKTPLTVILGYVEKLNLDNSMSVEERGQVLNRLHQKTLNVIALLNQFFDLVKLDSGDYSIPLSRISINEICRKNVLEFYSLLQSKNLQVEVNIPELSYFILGNEEAINRVLSNLISNAIRYGSDGGVFGLDVREEGDYIAIDIWDKGKGIAKVHQEQVFERLYTLDDARNPEFQGSGLGLSITKHLVEAMKGSINLNSIPYEKTVFTCIFHRITY
ncbi:two-component sensor histidine kinase [Neobacillus piezotolerans]|uniref:histidine kinase n=1 Tax=Neobacillus piezotolerans TaxID=2259171 RepID=A0A3D8GW70_9BACI|nr:sensor histidine kinase [Neobacillus piezotolerans]RDU38704.1 two-component sensor histidine kinase [Neobacillus piezotolerans]